MSGSAAWRDEFVDRVKAVADDYRYSDEFLGGMVRELFSDREDEPNLPQTAEGPDAANESKFRPTREEALRVADDLLRRLSEWDMLNFYIGQAGEPIEPTADAPYWRGEIARARAYIAGARA